MGIRFSNEERAFLLLYWADSRCETIQNIEKMKSYLQYDEKDLLLLSNQVIEKINSLTDTEFEQLGILEEFMEGVIL